jgi:hypothetical protein
MGSMKWQRLGVAIAGALVASIASAQSPGLSIVDQQFDGSGSRLTIVVQNHGRLAVSAVSFVVLSNVDNGSVLTSYRSYDFYLSQAAIELGGAVTEGLIESGERRTFELAMPSPPRGYVSSASAQIVATVYSDRTANGTSADIDKIFEGRRRDRDEFARWLGEVEGISKGRSPREALDITSKRLLDASSARPLSGTAMALHDNVRRAIAADQAGKRAASEALPMLLRMLRAQHTCAVVNAEPAVIR